MSNKNFKLPLIAKVAIAIALGIGGGLVFPDWALRIFLTTNSIISSFIGLFIPVLILGLVSAGIAELGKGAGKMLLLTVAIAYFSTILAGGFSFIVSSFTFKDLIGVGTLAGGSQGTLTPFFEIKMPPFIDVTSALVLSFILGISSSLIQGRMLKNLIFDFRDVVTMVITKVIVPLLPLYIFGIFMSMTAQNAVGQQLMLLMKIVVIIFAMHITVLIVQYLIAGFISRKNPFKSLVTMLPAYLTALGTSSSAATIPVSLTQAKKNGVSNGVADFVIPLCATIHMPCSLLKIVACAVALMVSMNIPVDSSAFIHFIFMAGIALVAAPGVPGGCIMAALGPLASILGFSDDMLGMMIALYILMDSFGTAGNITGDCAIALIINTIFKGRYEKSQEATAQ